MKWNAVMLRKLAVFIICAGLAMSPLSVQALGFGGIKLKSSLNDNLNAEVALSSASENDIQSLKIKLATNEAFLRAGIERNAFLNNLDFKVKQYANGDYYIHITTAESVREPFLDFLLDLNWKNGRMLREYTMLIDPPGRTPKQRSEPTPVVAETIAIASAAKSEPEVVSEPGLDIIETPAPTQPAMDAMPAPFDPDSTFVEESPGELWPRIPLTPYSEAEDSENAEAKPVAEIGNLDYGITKAKDNLWTIAEKLRQGNKNISVYQVMMALLQSNPDAFIDNNVHRLKTGHVLRINNPAALTSLSRKEAANAYIEQTKTWNNYRKQAAGATTVQPVIARGTAEEKSVTENTAGALTLSSPDGESLVSGGGATEETLSNDLATMQDQLRQTKTDASTMRSGNVALNEKLQLLEDE